MKPYLISAFDYSNSSAGNRCLHKLAHELNTRGYEARVLTNIVNPYWDTRPLNINLAFQYVREGAIVVYPETVPGNQMSAKNVARWVLNYPGLLPWGEKTYAPTEKVFYYLPIYSPNPSEKNLLFMSVIEPQLFNHEGVGERKGGVRYVGKGRDRMRKSKTPLIPEDHCEKEITWGFPATRKEVAELLRRSEYLLTYDNSTALIDEARMCGCPVVIVPDGSTNPEIYNQVCNTKGMVFSFADLEKARASVGEFYQDYLQVYKKFNGELDNFIKLTQL